MGRKNVVSTVGVACRGRFLLNNSTNSNERNERNNERNEHDDDDDNDNDDDDDRRRLWSVAVKTFRLKARAMLDSPPPPSPPTPSWSPPTVVRHLPRAMDTTMSDEEKTSTQTVTSRRRARSPMSGRWVTIVKTVTTTKTTVKSYDSPVDQYDRMTGNPIGGDGDDVGHGVKAAERAPPAETRFVQQAKAPSCFVGEVAPCLRI